MPVDIDKLMRFRVPDARQALSARDIAFYSLSIGVGQDALDASHLEYVDPLRGPKVMPAMVLVMAHPGFYLSDPESGVDPKMVLHSEQAIEILGRVPGEGLVESRTRITDVIDKGPGKAALIMAETELFHSDRAFARLNRTTFIREGGGFGGSPLSSQPVPVNQVPDTAPDALVDMETRPDQALLYRLNGDYNPLHSDPELARRAGFERPILHGLCTMGIVCNAILRNVGYSRVEALRSVRLRFSKPVYPGETIRTEIWNDGSFRARVPSRDITVIDGGLAVFDHTGI
ncbi:MaoC dehydratase-like protein [Rhizobium sp. PP-F2F-G48]|uniref:MaoC/PaaZ C-terminal domain-containing protein n=1 Tax=Rhizobium sp. PP-F2F-G48 TaxID=2135651 RepID=UPI00104980F3|nr:MaoC/PaaZ C-terminal domain-containing protein [Rhizobium sp. PP-F2F-G48]TCM47199.1 MaoC dehydratase-like protein [Rhizobium sp. PP-F2F-G48]